MSAEVEPMGPRFSTVIFLFIILAMTASLGAQSTTSGDIFTITVAAPVSATDIQVRYFLTDDQGSHWFATTYRAEGDKVVIEPGPQGRTARSLRAIVYAPGCQFGTIRVDDLAASNRQGEFHCEKLQQIELHGRADVSALGNTQVKMEALYVCDWAARFFGVTNGSVSPISIGRVAVNSDGTFTVSMPDFTNDPLWASLSYNASLLFEAVDTKNGKHFPAQATSGELSQSGALKVASVYPAEVDFSIHQ
jgi:hypothetical protein